MKRVNILCIDTTSEFCSVSLFENKTLIENNNSKIERSHSKLLINVVDDILIAPFNDLQAAEMLVDEFKDIAAIIVEPLQRIISPVPGFLEGLRELCNKNNILLIFDEIVTGFRLAYGGAQERYGVTPDICTLGKIIGGGFPLAALGAKKEIMKHLV